MCICILFLFGLVCLSSVCEFIKLGQSFLHVHGDLHVHAQDGTFSSSASTKNPHDEHDSNSTTGKLRHDIVVVGELGDESLPDVFRFSLDDAVSDTDDDDLDADDDADLDADDEGDSDDDAVLVPDTVLATVVCSTKEAK